MTRDGIRSRWLDFLARLHVLAYGLPHGIDPQLDVDRRLARTAIGVVFDVGANQGQSVIRLRRWYPEADIHCFEPVSSTFAVLERAVSKWRHVHAHQLALGASPGSAWIVPGPTDDQTQLTSAPNAGESVIVETLDRVVERLGITSIDYLKIDTEGRDLDVLHGGIQIIRRGLVRIVEVEAGMHPENRFHARAFALASFLEENAYRLFGVYEQVLEWPTADAHLRRANLVFVSAETIRRNHWPSVQEVRG